MDVYESQNPLLKKYMHSIYFYKKGVGQMNYLAFPTTGTPLALIRNAEVKITPGEVIITKSGKENYKAMFCNILFKPLKMRYEQTPDEIAINFKPACFFNFIHNSFITQEDSFFFNDWDHFLEDLFNKVFAAEENDRLKIVEDFLLARCSNVDHFDKLTEAAQIVSDFENEYSSTEVAKMVGLHYKVFYRNFIKYIGCSPAHFRKIARFRNSVNEKINNRANTKLVKISYNNNYTDQSYFIKEYQKHTGENPKSFFDHISILGDSNKIVWKFL